MDVTDAVFLAFEAVARYDVSGLRRYLESGGSTRITATPVEETLLHCAIRHYPERASYQPMLDVLLDADFHLIDIADVAGNTPLHYAVQFSNMRVLQWLLMNDADIWKLNSVGELPVQVSVKKTADTSVTSGIDNEYARVSNVLQLWTQGDRAAQKQMAHEWREAETSERMVINEALWNDAAKAIEYKTYDDLIRALDNGVALNESQELTGRTLLMRACECAYVAGVQILLARGSDVNHKDLRGRTALHAVVVPAPTDDNVAVLQILLDAGADPTVDDVGSALVDRSLHRLNATGGGGGLGGLGGGGGGPLAVGPASGGAGAAGAGTSAPAPPIKHGFPLQYACAYADLITTGRTSRVLSKMVAMLRVVTEEALVSRPDTVKALAKRTMKALRALRAFKWNTALPLLDDGPLVTPKGEQTPLMLQRVITRLHAGKAAEDGNDEIDRFLAELDRAVPRQTAAVAAAKESEELAALKRRLRVRMPVAVSVREVGKRGVVTVSKNAVVAFVGRVHFADGFWVGLRMDEACGHHDGTWEGKRYFVAPRNCGMFVRPDRIEDRADRRD